MTITRGSGAAMPVGPLTGPRPPARRRKPGRLAAETLDAADVRAGIPMRGGVDSLNVGVAAGIAFWVLGRRMGRDGT